METESIIEEITQGVNIWEGVRQEINRFGKRLIEGEAYRRVAGFYQRWHASEPRAAANFLQDIENSLSYFHLPLKQPQHRSKLKTVNKLESFFRALRRKIHTIGTFENMKSLERHLFALIMLNKTKKDTPYMLFTQNS